MAENIKEAAHAVSEKVKGRRKRFVFMMISIWEDCFFLFAEVTSGASYEANKQAAKNENLPVGDRIGHGIDAVKDKSKNSLLICRDVFTILLYSI